MGILYAAYLGGDEGYTASACDGEHWFDQLSWLAVNRAPLRWHRWTFEYDPEEGLRILHDGKDVNDGGMRFDAARSGLEGFRSIAVWGDAGPGGGQAVWVDGASVTLGGPVKKRPVTEADPYAEAAWAADPDAGRPAVIYTRASPPPAPRIEELPLERSVTQYGITWTFESRPGSGSSSTATGTSWGRRRSGRSIPAAALRRGDPRRASWTNGPGATGGPAGPQRLHAQSAGRG